MFERVVRFQALYRPAAPAIWSPQGPTSFGRLDADVDRVAKSLRDQTGPRSIVAVRVKSLGLHWTILLALSRLGCITASLPQVGERPISRLLSLINPDLVITDTVDREFQGSTVLVDESWLQAVQDMPPDAPPQHTFAPHDAVRLVLSSGTTGVPKKMLLTRDMVDARIRTGAISQMGHRKLFVGVGPDTETGFRAPLVAWTTGASVVHSDLGPSGGKDLAEITPGALIMVPAQLDALLADLKPEAEASPDLAVLVISGIPSPRTMLALRERISPNIYVTYGSTETGLVALMSPQMYRNSPRMSGLISPSTLVEVVGKDGASLPARIPGAIRVKTDEMVSGYAGDDDAGQNNSFRDGWFYTGDIGYIENSEILTITGRETDVLDLGGMRISLAAVEQAVISTRGVIEAAALEVRPSGRAPSVAIALVYEEGFALERLRQKLQLEFPQTTFKLVRVKNIPKSHRGKIDRQALVQQIIDADKLAR